MQLSIKYYFSLRERAQKSDLFSHCLDGHPSTYLICRVHINIIKILNNLWQKWTYFKHSYSHRNSRIRVFVARFKPFYSKLISENLKEKLLVCRSIFIFSLNRWSSSYIFLLPRSNFYCVQKFMTCLMNTLTQFLFYFRIRYWK